MDRRLHSGYGKQPRFKAPGFSLYYPTQTDLHHAGRISTFWQKGIENGGLVAQDTSLSALRLLL